MTSRQVHTDTRDGRFQLYHRIKDGWGDFDAYEEHWKLIDLRYRCDFARWSNEGDRDYESVAFSPDERRVVVRAADGTSRDMELPPPPAHEPRALELRSAVFDAPDDDAPRRAYAEWLRDRKDPRGEFIDLQLAGADVQDLLKRHALAWLSADELPLTREAVFRRGFVEELRLQVFEPAILETLLEEPAAACLRALDMSFSTNGNVLAKRLAASPRTGGLRHVKLGSSDLGETGARALAASRHLRLESIEVGYTMTEAGRALLRARGWKVT